MWCVLKYLEIFIKVFKIFSVVFFVGWGIGPGRPRFHMCVHGPQPRVVLLMSSLAPAAVALPWMSRLNDPSFQSSHTQKHLNPPQSTSSNHSSQTTGWLVPHGGQRLPKLVPARPSFLPRSPTSQDWSARTGQSSMASQPGSRRRSWTPCPGCLASDIGSQSGTYTGMMRMPRFLGLTRGPSFGGTLTMAKAPSGWWTAEVNSTRPSFDSNDLALPLAPWKGSCGGKGIRCNNSLPGAKSFIKYDDPATSHIVHDFLSIASIVW